LRPDKTDRIRVTLLAIGEGGPIKNIKDIFQPKLETKVESAPAVHKIKHKKPVRKQAPRPPQKISVSIEKPLPKSHDTLRKNAIEVKRESEDHDKKISEQEKKWDIPAFLRIKK
jgi:hypothetical protein